MMIPNAVPEEALDYDEIFRRGGANKGDEDFALCQCPHCGCIYLVEYEVDTLYIDARDLRRRIAVNLGVDTIACDACGNQLPSVPWVGPDAPPSMQVSWSHLARSPWCWITVRTRKAV